MSQQCDAIEDAIDAMIALGDCGDMLPREQGPGDVRPDDQPGSDQPLAA